MVVLRVTEEEGGSALGALSGVTSGNYLSSLNRQGTSVTENICAGVTLERVSRVFFPLRDLWANYGLSVPREVGSEVAIDAPLVDHI